MDAFTQWNIDFMKAIQEIGGPFLTDLFRAFTFLGNDEFYLLLLPLLFWCINPASGARITILFLLSAFLNSGAKEIVQAPRPFELDPSVLKVEDPEMINATGYGMPSGHAQLTSTVWAALALQVRKGWFWVGAGVIAFMVGFSRIYLGAHSPIQVAAGWGLGIAVFGLYLVVYLPIEEWLGRLSLGPQLGVASSRRPFCWCSFPSPTWWQRWAS